MIGKVISHRLRGASPLMARRLFSEASSSRCSLCAPPVHRSSGSTCSSSAEADVLSVNWAPPSPKSATIPTLLQPRVLIYDGVCHLCHRGVKWVIQADKYEKIKFCCLQSKAAEPYLHLCGLTREDVLKRVLFVEGPESYSEGSTAALKVASYLPYPYAALSALLIIPASIRDAVYDYIAKRRYAWFGKDDKCLVMHDKDLLDRFIDREELFGDWDEN
ncbi:DCC1-like thiol-disulfide oxidoreductase family protein [Dioscorea alata]|uniref:DCC1-like thiol-disulfide oxidoreductase family protein n=1 Tax=Dioscorea alata TaxID=55571 RepID=A0ACB7VJK8_DIOAL|nr:DCC1-like thiol-disulfide oxidoreductase family protein [Dioscorea alata]